MKIYLAIFILQISCQQEDLNRSGVNSSGNTQDQNRGEVPPPPETYQATDDELKQDFYNLDKDENGYLDPHEIRTGYPGIFEDDITGFFTSYDYDKDGVISLEEYMTLPKTRVRKPTTQNQ